MLRTRAREVEIDEISASILVASRDDLIMLKQATGRIRT